MSQNDAERLTQAVVEARTSNLVLESLCAMLVVELSLLKAPRDPLAEAGAMMDRFGALADAFGRQPGGMGKLTAPIATAIADRVRVVAETTLRSHGKRAA